MDGGAYLAEQALDFSNHKAMAGTLNPGGYPGTQKELIDSRYPAEQRVLMILREHDGISTYAAGTCQLGDTGILGIGVTGTRIHVR